MAGGKKEGRVFKPDTFPSVIILVSTLFAGGTTSCYCSRKCILGLGMLMLGGLLSMPRLGLSSGSSCNRKVTVMDLDG